ncbi:MAG: hypothetical protein IH594_01840 [Bacteroidales bacterium]|nr:hypothetical protein [Bacteroidales bacterium]
MSLPYIVFIVVSAVGILLFLVLKLKISAFISLLMTAILAAMPLKEIMESIAKEMGDTLGFAATVAVLVGKTIGVFVERMSASVRVDFPFT